MRPATTSLASPPEPASFFSVPAESQQGCGSCSTGAPFFRQQLSPGIGAGVGGAATGRVQQHSAAPVNNAAAWPLGRTTRCGGRTREAQRCGGMSDCDRQADGGAQAHSERSRATLSPTSGLVRTTHQDSLGAGTAGWWGNCMIGSDWNRGKMPRGPRPGREPRSRPRKQDYFFEAPPDGAPSSDGIMSNCLATRSITIDEGWVGWW